MMIFAVNGEEYLSEVSCIARYGTPAAEPIGMCLRKLFDTKSARLCMSVGRRVPPFLEGVDGRGPRGRRTPLAVWPRTGGARMMRHAPTKTTWHEVVTALAVMGIIIFLFLV